MGADMKLFACAVTAMSLLAGAAQAGEWRVADVDGTIAVFVDTSTIRKLPYSNKKVAWVAYVYPNTQDNGADYILAQSEYDCSAMTEATSVVIGYDLNGVSLHTSREKLPLESVIPDTRGHAVYRAVCEGIDKPASETVGEVLAIYRDIMAEDN